VPFAVPADLAVALDRVEQLYAARGLPSVFQVGPDALPIGLDGVLAARGYAIGSPTVVLVADVEAGDGTDVSVAGAPDQDWLELWWAVDGRGDASALAVAQAILCGGPALYATIRDSLGPVAVARLALVRDWGGLYCMAVQPDARRQGFGAALLRGVLDVGWRHGVRHCWLQARAENSGARRLYQRAGFTEVARYHYRSLHSGQKPVQHVHAEA
jgi:ribosomal protein S18 acetylase RimI-like enzyme